MAKHHLYDESPSIKHDEEGHTKVVKTPKSEHGDGPTEKGVEGEHFPMHVKHGMERQSMYARHEMEHGIHDAAKAGDKKEMHDRHEKEMKEMHTRHEKESGMNGGAESGAGGSTGKPSEPIAKAEKGKKE